jgi:hypothetical protein
MCAGLSWGTLHNSVRQDAASFRVKARNDAGSRTGNRRKKADAGALPLAQRLRQASSGG